jgi:hypothetical protein
MQKFITKYHSYIVALTAFAAVVFQFLTGIAVPEFVYSALASVGIVSVRVTVTQADGVGGWKTYALAAGEGLLAAARAFGIDIPYEVDAMLISLAGGTVVQAIKKSA